MQAESRRSRRFKLPLHVLAAAGSTLLLVAVALVLAWNAYQGTRRVISSAVNEDISRVSAVLNEKVKTVLTPAEYQLDLLAQLDIARAKTLEERLEAIPTARVVLSSNPLLEAWYVGYSNGEFILFRLLRDEAFKKVLKAPEGATMLVQTQSRSPEGVVSGEYRYYDETGRLLRLQPRPDYVYDPRSRRWYWGAETDTVSITEPYVFFTTREIGASLSRAVGSDAVIGMDAALKDLTTEIAKFRITPGTRGALITGVNSVLATDRSVLPMAKEADGRILMASLSDAGERVLAEAAKLPAEGAQRAVMAGKEDWEIISVPIALGREARALRVVLAIPHQELFKDAREQLHNNLIVTLMLILASIPAGFWLTQQIVRPLRALVEDTRAIAAFDFNARIHRGSRIAEVDMLADATMQMKRTIARFLEVSTALNSEMRLERLLHVVLTDVAQTTGARSGALYLADDHNNVLSRSQFHGHAAREPLYPERVEADEASAHAAGLAAWRRASVVGPVNGGPGELVAVPLETLSKEIVGVIVLELSRPLMQPKGKGRDPLLAFIESLSSTAAVAIESRHLLESQKRLMEGLIHLVASAIDAKSPYTGGHCARVPELTSMLVKAASDAHEGPFRNFSLSPDEWEAVHVGAWLHDCGKVTTPEYVVDKATKLETIYNRIHEVRTRFEVLKRDAEIMCWKAIAEGRSREAAMATMQGLWAQLDEEFAFVARCNVGGESLDPAKVERLQEIAQRTWARTLDNRLGLSIDELRRLQGSEPEVLPVQEHLLVDRPEHRVPRPEKEVIPPDNPWGFRMKVPLLKFDLGELHNLSVSRGTLTEEERYIINEHIMQTIIMLSQLPFPRHLRNVPEIAGGHHERMDGRGYPKGLTREQMSIPARIMAVADVFEALTAADRPYKAAKTLSESLGLMAQMVRNQHLDGDVFTMFLREGIYRQYAERFLSPAQIDAVDVDALLAAAQVPSKEPVA